jgi:RNA-directed DNA polymerase
MTTNSYHNGCYSESQEHGKTAVWVVNFNNGNLNNNHRNNNACVRAVRSSEYRGTEKIVSLKALHQAWKKARAGKKPSANQLAFDAKWCDGLLNLQQQINEGAWKPKRSACFIATKPKAREIHAPDFSDRIVHHWLIPQLEAIWEPSFIFDSFANRKGKGSHAAVNRLKQFVRQVHSGQGGGWYLQLDIHNFFNSIHRPTLWEILKKKLVKTNQSETVMRVTHSLLRRPPLSAGFTFHGTKAEKNAVPLHKRLENAAPGCGLPIGNLSSQFFSNVYLDRLDQFVKHNLKAARYLRYSENVLRLKMKKEIAIGTRHLYLFGLLAESKGRVSIRYNNPDMEAWHDLKNLGLCEILESGRRKTFNIYANINTEKFMFDFMSRIAGGVKS